jgi:hypothetical protein
VIFNNKLWKLWKTFTTHPTHSSTHSEGVFEQCHYTKRAPCHYTKRAQCHYYCQPPRVRYYTAPCAKACYREQKRNYTGRPAQKRNCFTPTIYDYAVQCNTLLLLLMMTKMRKLPPINELRNSFIYDSATGFIYKRGQTREAGFVNPYGYRIICYKHDGRWINLWAHRLAYALFYGVDPYPKEIDHIDGQRDNNRCTNLRTATRKEQMNNTVTNAAPRQKYRVTRRPRPSICVYRNLDRWTVIIKGVYYGHTNTFEEGIILRDRVIAEHNLSVLLP